MTDDDVFNDDDYDDARDHSEDITDCPACGGVLAYLGQLGRLLWFRCIACGLDVNHAA